MWDVVEKWKSRKQSYTPPTGPIFILESLICCEIETTIGLLTVKPSGSSGKWKNYHKLEELVKVSGKEGDLTWV